LRNVWAGRFAKPTGPGAHSRHHGIRTVSQDINPAASAIDGRACHHPNHLHESRTSGISVIISYLRHKRIFTGPARVACALPRCPGMRSLGPVLSTPNPATRNARRRPGKRWRPAPPAPQKNAARPSCPLPHARARTRRRNCNAWKPSECGRPPRSRLDERSAPAKHGAGGPALPALPALCRAAGSQFRDPKDGRQVLLPVPADTATGAGSPCIWGPEKIGRAIPPSPPSSTRTTALL
jgi:hypothetical protein